MTFVEWIFNFFSKLFAKAPEAPVPVEPPKPDPKPPITLLNKQLCIDVSHYEPPVDWVKAKAGGVGLMYAKATEHQTDSLLRAHVSSAHAAGVRCGAYHFFHPNESGRAQALRYLKAVEGLPLTLPHCLDWESSNGLSSGDQQREALAWLETVEQETRQTPIIYGGESFLHDLKLPPKFARYHLWMAHYGVNESRLKIPAPWTKLYGWQYTDAEGVPRVYGLAPGHHVDASWFYV